jgi:hypothetical protein
MALSQAELSISSIKNGLFISAVFRDTSPRRVLPSCDARIGLPGGCRAMDGLGVISQG